MSFNDLPDFMKQNSFNQTNFNQNSFNQQKANEVIAMYKQIQNAANPSKAFNDLLQKNPQLAQMSRQPNLRTMYYQMAKSIGVNPEEFLANFK